MSQHLSRIKTSIADNAATIEGAFLKAGDGLNQGLATFRALNDSLVALGAELDSGASASAAVSLERLSRSMVAVGDRLPQDARTLAELVDGNHAITARFANLADNMRMMTIISRSARIEAVSFDDERLGLESFTRAISKQISDVQRDIHGCANEHANLTRLLQDAAQTQLDFEATYREKLMTLAGELGEAFRLIGRRREDGTTLVRDAAARSVRIAQAAGMALISLQVGDATRQRLEHIAQAVGRASALTRPGTGSDAAVPDHARAATAAMLCRLQDAQLRDAATCFDAEAVGVLKTLAAVAEETRSLVALGIATYGQTGEGEESFMAAFRSRFAIAMRLVETCEDTRRMVEAAIVQLRAMLANLSRLIETLGTTSRDLVLVGMNVGLKAARLGPEGRSLVVVAEELKRLAGEISAHAQDLLPMFRRVGELSDRFGGEDGEAIVASGQLDREFSGIVAELDRGDQQVAALLGSLNTAGRSFEARLGDARRSFENATQINRFLVETADVLGACADEGWPSGDAVAEAGRLADAILQAAYTMSREREIHAQVVSDSVENAAPPAAWAA